MSDIDRLTTALAGRYAVERELGSGGMATVYLARDLKHERPVAIKVLRPDLRRSGYHPERFLREIKILANLTHPQILPLHDSDECDGFLFYVMPFVPGETLRACLTRESRLPVQQAVTIARGMAGALDYAHRHDVLHRDVKPENIFLLEGQPLVSDFGIARAISSCCDNLTEGGFALGTPAYMSPEQVSGTQELDGRSDLYSLACVVYEMLAGRPPFVDEDVRRILTRHMSEEAQPLRALRPDVPASVAAAVQQALAKEPAARFATVGAFGDALLALTGRSVHGAPPRQTVGHAVAVLPFVNASPDPDNEYLSDGITDELINALTKVEGLRVVSRTSVFALKGERKDVRSIGALLGVTAVLEGTVQKAGDKLRITARLTDVTDGRHLWSERYDRQIRDVFAIQDEIAQTIVTTLRRSMLSYIGDPTPKRYTESVTAYNLYLKGRYHWNRRTREGIDAAIRYFEQAIAHDPAFALAYSGLSDSYALHLDYRDVAVAEGMQRARAEAQRALELDDTLAEAHTSLGWVTFLHDWDWPAAEREFTRAIELNPRYATARQWYSWLLMALGRTDEALAEGRAALELDPISVSIRRAIGWLHTYARQLEVAVPHLERAVAMDPTAGETHRILGLAYAQAGRFREAAASLEEAIALSGDSAYARAAQGYLYAIQGREPAARDVLEALRTRAGTTYVSPVAFAMLNAGLGEADATFHWLDRAYEERRGWLVYLKVEPILDGLRSDERFDRLLEKMRLG